MKKYKKKWILYLINEKFLFFIRTIFAFMFGQEKCLCCGSLSGIIPLCKKCISNKLFIPIDFSKRCKLCGKTLISENEICLSCREYQLLKSPDYVLPLYSYRLWFKELLFEWKLQDKRALSCLFAKSIYDAIQVLIQKKIISEKFCIVPVPPRPGKIKERGWDQIDDICIHLKKRFNLTIYEPLERITVKQQKKLDREQRLQMMNKSYKLKTNYINNNKHEKLPENVILIDDILTTGVTLESCSSLLKQCGVLKVVILTLFIVD